MGVSQSELWGVSSDTILGVGAYTRRIKAILEGSVPASWVRGEVSNLKTQSSGHIYFTLKDSESQLPVVLFRGKAMQQSVRLRDGLSLLVYGELSLYEPRGAYQMIARALLDEGQGRLRLEFERLKQKLEGEGLFSPSRKKSLPQSPKVVGVITSPSGAVIQDFVKILQRSGWKGSIILFPAKVQGAGAIQEIVTQIRVAEAMGGLDLLVIGRGGGSIEDLWAFNEELVVRAVAACRVPTIAAVGHETDTTLVDFAADKRAETPSAAASWIAGTQQTLLQRYQHARADWSQAFAAHYEQKRQAFVLLQRTFQVLHPSGRVENGWLACDELSARLTQFLEYGFLRAQQSLAQVRRHFYALEPTQALTVLNLRFSNIHHQLDRQAAALLAARRQAWLILGDRLERVKLERVLDRGFMYLTDDTGQVMRSQKQLPSGKHLVAHFVDGKRGVVAD